MAFQAVPNVALTRCEGLVDSQITINDLYWEISGGGINITNLTTLTVAVSDWFKNTLAPLLSQDWAAVRTVGVDLTTQTGPEIVVSSAQTGGVAVEAAPNNVAACVSIRTAQRGRSFRGRNFVPGIPNSLITLNTLDSAFISDLLAAYGGLLGAGIFVAGWQLGVVSRFTGGSPRPSGIISPATGMIMTSNKVRSMRSREIGHGK